ncbi:Processing protease [Sulfurovum sp. enrichment culture clone C5]|uniref:Processing protease n=1 Tax=Sulfurovum sp. enrichment culture clone C5 TaxID=497650 RepID=A0A0S4XNV4_9BACT|nr:Processing protease [Sulfurovum sp. enrichment culture clone C5]
MGASVFDIDVKGSKVPLIFEENKALPIVSMQIVFTNSGQLSSKKDGLVSMSAALLNEGTKKSGSVGFATKLDDKAITISSYAGRENFVIVVSSLKSEFKTAVLLLEELLKDPNYTDDSLSKIKMQKMGWLEQKKSDFDYIGALTLRQNIFEGTDLARDYEGTPKSIKSMTLEQMKDFIHSHLGYNNAIMVIGGDLSLEDAKDVSKNILSNLPKTENKVLPKLKASDKEIIKYNYNSDTEQAYIYFGAPFDFDYSSEEQYKAKIMEYILGGGGFGSRIMEEIRVKRGLAYSAYASLQRTKSASYLSGYLQTKLENEQKAKEIVREVINEFTTKGITQKELDEAKEFLVGSEALRVETLSQRLNRAFDDYYYGRPLGFSSEQNKLIDSVTLKEMNEFIASHKEITKLSFGVVTKK